MPVRYTLHDRELCDTASLIFSDGQYVKFQFPPTIPTDSRRGNWKEAELRGTEPIAVFATSGPREISLLWHYIVDGHEWDVPRIKEQIQLIRGYFARIKDPREDRRNLVVMFQLWSITGEEPWSARLKNIDVKHGATIVGRGKDAFHLRTDIAVDIRIWTNGAASGATSPIQSVPGLKPELPSDWY